MVLDDSDVYNSCFSICQSMKTELEAVKRERFDLLTDKTVLLQALEQKKVTHLEMEEENRRLRENVMDQKEIKRRKQLLKQGQAEVQRGLQEVKEEKDKMKVHKCLCVNIVHYCS